MRKRRRDCTRVRRNSVCPRDPPSPPPTTFRKSGPFAPSAHSRGASCLQHVLHHLLQRAGAPGQAGGCISQKPTVGRPNIFPIRPETQLVADFVVVLATIAVPRQGIPDLGQFGQSHSPDPGRGWGSTYLCQVGLVLHMHRTPQLRLPPPAWPPCGCGCSIRFDTVSAVQSLLSADWYLCALQHYRMLDAVSISPCTFRVWWRCVRKLR